MITPQEALRRWQKNTSEATESYTAGIAAVTENPAASAIAKKDKWAEGVRRAAEDDRYARGLSRVTLQGWKDAATKKGARRLADGVKEGAPKMAMHLQNFLPFLAGVTAQVNAMPDTTEAERDAKMLAQIRLTREYRNR